MRKLITILALLISSFLAYSQTTPVTILKTTTELTNYLGASATIFLTDYLRPGFYYLYIGANPVDNVNIFAGSGGRKWGRDIDIVYAGNGLSKSNDTVVAGGALNRNTVIAGGAFTWGHTFNTITDDGFSVTSTSAAVNTNAAHLINAEFSGANAGSTLITRAIYGSNLRTGTTSTNYGVYGLAGSGSTNIGVAGVISGSGGTGVSGFAGSGIGVYGNSNSSVGVQASSSSSAAFFGYSGTGLGADLSTTAAASTSTPINVLKLTTQTASAGASNGFGGYISLGAETGTASSNQEAGQIIWRWSTAAEVSRVSEFAIKVVDNAISTERFKIAGNGQITESAYGTGAFTGTLARISGWTAAGVRIEVHPDSIGGAGGAGDVVGPASSTDNAVPRYVGTTGKILENTTLIYTDGNELRVPGAIQVGATATLDARTKFFAKDNSTATSSFAVFALKANGDNDDFNIEGGIVVKHSKSYALTPGYGGTIQFYGTDNSYGSVWGQNSFTGGGVLPYTPTIYSQPNSYHRWELGPIWPQSEKMRLNNSGDLIIGMTTLRSYTASQSGSSTVNDPVNSFFAADAGPGRFFAWGNQSGGTVAYMDKITGFTNANNITTERVRTIAAQNGRVIEANAMIDTAGNAYFKIGNFNEIHYSQYGTAYFKVAESGGNQLLFSRTGVTTGGDTSVSFSSLGRMEFPRDIVLNGSHQSTITMKSTGSNRYILKADAVSITQTISGNTPIATTINGALTNTWGSTGNWFHQPVVIGVSSTPASIGQLDILNSTKQNSFYVDNTRTATSVNRGLLLDVTATNTADNIGLYATSNGSPTDKAIMIPSSSGSGATDRAISNESLAPIFSKGSVVTETLFRAINTPAQATVPDSVLAVDRGAGDYVMRKLPAYQPLDADLTTWAGITPGTGVATALAVNVGSAGAFVTFNGALGTPSSGTLTNATGLPQAGVINLVTDLGNKQATLVSGTNIKTINGSSILGSGDLVVTGSGMTNPMTTLGDIIYGGSAGAPTALAGAAGFLKSTGAAAPTWSSIASTDIDATVSSTEFGYINTLSSNAQDQLDGKLGLLTTEYTTTVPSTPATGVTLYSTKRGATALAWVNSIGEYFEAMPHTGIRRLTGVVGDPGSSTAIYVNTRAGLFTATGTAVARTPALTSILTQSYRVGYESAGTAGQTAGQRFNTAYLWRGNAAGQGGFDVLLKFGFSATASGWLFMGGLTSTNISSATTNPSTLTNKFAFAKDAADATLQLIYNDASGACTKVNTTITPSTTTVYLARFWCKPNDSNMYAALYDYENNVLFESGPISSEIPTNTTGLLWQLFISNNATAAVVGIDLLTGTIITNH